MKIIFALDGGGIRGVVPAAILDYLEKRIQEVKKDKRIRISNLVDMVAGTSTGSILGSLMLTPCEAAKTSPKHSMSEIVEMYIQMGPDVFRKTLWHKIKTLWGVFGPIYPASNIEPDLLQMLDHIRMDELIKPCLFTGYDIDKRRVNIYTNCDTDQKYGSYYVKDIVRGSTSIPAYFPPAYFREGVDVNTVIDGGVFANNPSMVAYIEASKCLFDYYDPTNLDPANIMVFSFGTGAAKRKSYPYNKAKRWGKANWVFPILDVMLAGIGDVVDYEMQKLYEAAQQEDNYQRINPPLRYSKEPSTDASPENITNLLKDVKAYIEINKDYLNDMAQIIMDNNIMVQS